MTTKKKISLLILSLLILTGGYFAVQYAIYQYNEARGFCATEGRYLNAEEKRRNFVTDYILYAMDFDRKRDFSFETLIYISKYDMSDPETIIDLMANTDINKSFEENFGVIAQANAPEYDARKRWIESCQKESVNCSKSKFDNSRYVEAGIKDLLNTDNTIDKDYLNSLPDTYTLITREGVGTYSIHIYPLSLMKPINEHEFQMGSYSLNESCCDKKAIVQAIEHNIPIPHNNDFMRLKSLGLLSDQEPELKLEDIDGDKIDNIYIQKLYMNLNLDQPEQIQRYGLRDNTGSLRKEFKNGNPSIQKSKVTACGILAAEEKAPRPEQGGH